LNQNPEQLAKDEIDRQLIKQNVLQKMNWMLW